MKSYQEMVTYVVDNCDGTQSSDYRYVKWVAAYILGHMFGKTPNEVSEEVNSELARRESVRRELRKQESRASNEARRLANLAKKDMT